MENKLYTVIIESPTGMQTYEANVSTLKQAREDARLNKIGLSKRYKIHIAEVKIVEENVWQRPNYLLNWPQWKSEKRLRSVR